MVSVLPDIDYIFDRINGTDLHSVQTIPIFITFVFFFVMFFSVEKYKKFSFLCLMGLGSQLFGDLLVGTYSFKVLESINAMPVSFYVFMASFEIIMPLIYLMFQLMKKLVASDDVKIMNENE